MRAPARDLIAAQGMMAQPTTQPGAVAPPS
jgi:hypothetical protein